MTIIRINAVYNTNVDTAIIP